MAHLDGLAVAGETGWKFCEEALANAGAGEVFTATVRVMEAKTVQRLSSLLAVVRAVPEARPGFAAAFGWTPSNRLQGIIKDLLRSADPTCRWTGVSACAMHRVDPGLISARRLEDPESVVRARALRCAGELGRFELVSTLAAAIAREDPVCQFWAAWSAVLLGDRQSALEFLQTVSMAEHSSAARAFQLTLQAMEVRHAHAFLRQLAQDPTKLQWLIRGAGLAGDPAYVPWLIGQMADDKLARLAGESFSMLTGVDLAQPAFERPRPENFASGPSDDPEDPDVAMDGDDELPWPDPANVQAWWNQHGARFTTGARHFMGAPASRSRCIDVLKNGYQHQRIAAAYHLCLLNPGTPLFEWRAPAWRQQRELAQMA